LLERSNQVSDVVSLVLGSCIEARQQFGVDPAQVNGERDQ
jgi:hypothetical protein